MANRVICATCKQDKKVKETTVTDPSGGLTKTHLHAVCENGKCAAKGDLTHLDVICSGSPTCGVHDNPDWHDDLAVCPDPHARGCGC